MVSVGKLVAGRPRVAAVAEVVGELRREWREDRVSGLAAEVAFFALLSLFPTVLAVTAALGSLEAIVGQRVAERAEVEVVAFLERVLTDEAAGTIDAVRALFDGPNPGLLTIGLVIALWAASRGFAAVINALGAAYDIEEVRPWIVVRGIALVLALGSIVVGALVLAMLVLGPLLGTGREVAGAIGLGSWFATFWEVVRIPVMVLVLIGWAATIYHVAPDHRTPWRWDLPGAALSAALWGLFSFGFRLYLAVGGGGNEVVGTLGGTLIVVLWLYLMSVGLILGGELNSVLARRHGVVQEHQDGQIRRAAVALASRVKRRVADVRSTGSDAR